MFRKSCSTLMIATALMVPAVASSAHRRATPCNDVIVLPGESNSELRGLGTFSLSSRDDDSLLKQVGHDGAANMQIVSASPYLQFPTNAKLHGYGMSVMRYWALTANDGCNVIGIPVAYDGTSILQWDNTIAGPGGLDLYADMKARINVALALPGARIVFWPMGEIQNDVNIARTPTDPNHALEPDAAHYEAHVLGFIDKVRADFGSGFPIGFLKTTPIWLPNNVVRISFVNALLDVSNQRPNVFVIDNAGVTANRDIDPAQNTLHMSAQGLEIEAARFAQGWGYVIPPNMVADSNMVSWPNGTTFNLAPITPTPVTDGWTAVMYNAGSQVVSRDAGWNGATYSMKWQRTPGSTSTATFAVYSAPLPPDRVAACAGKPSTVSFDASQGLNYSGNNDNLGVNIYTAGGVGEPFSYVTATFTSATTASPNLNAPLLKVASRYFVSYNIPANAHEAVIRSRVFPTGTAGDDDSFKWTNVSLNCGAVPSL